MKQISKDSKDAVIIPFNLSIDYEFIQGCFNGQSKWLCAIKVGEIKFESKTWCLKQQDAKSYCALMILYKLSFFHPNRIQTFKSVSKKQ